MADGSDEEKTEQPTGKRLRDARKEGQIPRSRELTTLLLLSAALASFWGMADWVGDGLIRVMHKGMTFQFELATDPQRLLAHIWNLAMMTLHALAPAAVVMVVAALIGTLAIGGWNVSTKSMQVDLKKLNPITGIKRQFGMQFVAEMAKAIAKTGLIGTVAAWFIYSWTPNIVGLSLESDKTALLHGLQIVAICAFFMLVAFIVVVLIDVPYQLWSHNKKLKMSKYEVKKEHKETEGDPQIKAKIRGQQQAMARARMMSAIPEADVVVTNPTHFAVALAYKQDRMQAPFLLAKGSDLIAARIRELAQEHDVPILEAPPLARALYQHGELDQEIPVDLYAAVAEVLAWVYQIRDYNRHGGYRPEAPVSLEVPPELDPQTAK